MSNKKIAIICIVSVLILMIAGVGGLVFLVFGTLKKSEAYKMTTDYIEKNSTVEEKLGTVTGYGYFPMGSVSVSNGSGKANLTLQVHGSKSEGSVHSEFIREPGASWMLVDATLTPAGSSDPLTIVPLEISSASFHDESATGAINNSLQYKQGDTIYWTLSIQKAHKRDGKVSLQEGLTVTNASGKIVFENPNILTYEDKLEGVAINLDSQVAVPDAGDYTIKTTVTDKFTSRVVSREDKIRILPSYDLKINSSAFHQGGFDGPLKDKNSYPKGETIYVTFGLSGYQLKEGNLSLSEDVSVTDSTDKLVLEQKPLLEINQAWDEKNAVNIENNIDLTDPGTYKIKTVIHDRNSGKDAEATTDVTIE